MKQQIIKTLIIAITVLCILSSNVFALGDIFEKGKEWESDGQASSTGTLDTTTIKDISSDVFNIFMSIGIAVIVIVGAILGVTFITAGVDKKVEVKQALITYVISSVVLVGAFGIWKTIVYILGKITI